MKVDKRKILFLDRDGTLINEPKDKQVDSMEKLSFIPGVISALLRFKEAGYSFIMVTNQNGIGSDTFPTRNFEEPHEAMMNVFRAEGILFDAVHICPHKAEEGCECRKPKIGLVRQYINHPNYDRSKSYFIGDRATDVELAQKMGICGIRLGEKGTEKWEKIVEVILGK